MKTATVTWTTYNNYGTVLQAYALQQELQKLGHENAILCDKEIIAEQTANKKARQKKPASQLQNCGSNESAFRRAVHVLLSLRKAERVLMARLDREHYQQPFYASQEAIEQFKRERLIIDSDLSLDSLEMLNERYDAFVAGSDQIWSVFERTFNPFFYLDFVTRDKIAYAPCLGTDQIPETMRQTLAELLSDYRALSAREGVTAQQLSELTGKECAWVVDPTILRNRSEWEKDAKKAEISTRSRYLLCYFLEDQAWYFEQAKQIAKMLRLRLLLIPNRWEYINSEYVVRTAVGPLEFVSLFEHADFVLTDSYHGSIFSLLFEKPFQYLQRFKDDDPNSQNIRILSLFSALDIERLIVPQGESADCHPEIEWPQIRETIGIMRNDSERYLINSLSRER